MTGRPAPAAGDPARAGRPLARWWLAALFFGWMYGMPLLLWLSLLYHGEPVAGWFLAGGLVLAVVGSPAGLVAARRGRHCQWRDRFIMAMAISAAAALLALCGWWVLAAG